MMLLPFTISFVPLYRMIFYDVTAPAFFEVISCRVLLGLRLF